MRWLPFCFFFFFNDTATTEIYTLSLHDALPIWFHRPTPARAGRRELCRESCGRGDDGAGTRSRGCRCRSMVRRAGREGAHRSEEHTSELQSQSNLVCRLLLEKKKKTEY